MTIEQVIQKAIEGGYKGRHLQVVYDLHGDINAALFNPDFWEALGKAMGWGTNVIDKTWNCLHCGIHTTIEPSKESGCTHVHFPEDCDICSEKALDWKDHWHSFIDHLADGETPETFFNQLK